MRIDRAAPVARRPGVEEVIVRRPRRDEGRCASPGCGEEPVSGRRFCASHAEVLDRVRAELEAEAGRVYHDRHWWREQGR